MRRRKSIQRLCSMLDGPRYVRILQRTGTKLYGRCINPPPDHESIISPSDSTAEQRLSFACSSRWPSRSVRRPGRWPRIQRRYPSAKSSKSWTGDTLHVQLESGPIRVRLYAVDAPEKAQAHGKEAAAALSTPVSGKRLEVEPFQRDRYKRLVGTDCVPASMTY